MAITLYDVIKKPLLSEKAQKINQEHGKLVLEVHAHANKPLVKSALKKLFNVEVEKVNILVRKGKSRNVLRGRITTVGPSKKIAVIRLKKGYSLDLFGTGETQASPKEQGSEVAKDKK